jgi:hypothetical protein
MNAGRIWTVATIKNRRVEKERALKERRDRNVRPEPRRMAQVLDFLENEIWSGIPRELLGRPITKKEREALLGY